MRYLINALKIVVASPNIEKMAREIASKFFPDIKQPSFKIVNHTIPKWLGSTKAQWRSGEDISITVYLQKSIIGDEKTLHRVLAHEMIHVWQYQTVDLLNESQLPKYARTDFHGESFEKMAAKMNAVFGSDYVTKTSDMTYVETGKSEYYILIQPHDKNRFGVSKFIRPSKKQKEEISKRIATRQAHVFKTKDTMFQNAAPLKEYGGYSVFSKQEVHDKLAEIYKGSNLDSKFK